MTADGDWPAAETGEAVTITLNRAIDVARGDVLAAADNAPTASASVEAELLWMAIEPLVAGREFTVRLGTALAHARIVSIRHAIDIQTYAYRKPASLKLNEIGRVELAFDKPLVTRPYATDRTLGAMILVDRLTHQTVGMATVQALIDRPKWRPSRRLAIYAVDGVVIGAIAGALSSSLALAALVGVAQMLLRPVVELSVGGQAVMDLHMVDPRFSLSGLLVGLLVGLTGVGGGSLMTPLLVLVFGIHPATAVGTDLLYASATKSLGTLVHGLNHTVDWRITRRLAYGSVPGTFLTLLVLSRVEISAAAQGHAISIILGVMLVLTALALVFRTPLLAVSLPHLERITPRQSAWLTVATGLVLGVLVTISSVGAGAIGVTALLLLYPRAKVAVIVGSDIAHAVPLTLAAGLGHWYLGNIDWGLLGSLLTGSLPGIVIGSALASRAPEIVLRPALALVLTVVSVRLAM